MAAEAAANGCMLIIDSRERHVYKHGSELASIRCKTAQITVGDYAVIDANGMILACIERKSLEDYGASIKDGRMENRQKMIDLRIECGCALIYIIEGDAFPDPNTRYAGISYKAIESSMFHMMMRDNIQILRSPSAIGTAQLLTRYVKSMNSLVGKQGRRILPHAVEGGDNETEDTAAIERLKKQVIKPDSYHISKMWREIKGVSEKTAEALSAKISIMSIFTEDAEALGTRLDQVKVGGARKLAAKTKQAILAARANGALMALMMSNAPNVQDSLIQFLSQKSVNEIVEGLKTSLQAPDASGKIKTHKKAAEVINRLFFHVPVAQN